jgi:3-oxoacyl-[acyl-carrier-protein] synthase II
MYEREVVVTGMGLVTPLGVGVERNWKNLLAGKTGIAHYPKSMQEQPRYSQYVGKVVDLLAPEDIPTKLLSQRRFLNRGSLLGFEAAREAIAQARFEASQVPPGRRALYIASGELTKVGCDFMHPAIKDATQGCWEEMDFERLNNSTLNKVNPFFLLESISNNLFSFLSAYLAFMGPNTSLASLSPCGVQALELAYRSIKYEDADIAMAVGCGNWITDIPLYEMDCLGLLSKCKHGAQSFKPFDRHRDGFIPAEGGAAVVLEASEKAEKRGAPIFAKIKGFGNCVEGSAGPSLSVPQTVHTGSIRKALEEARRIADDLAFVCPHGSGTQRGDRSELRSLVDVLGAKNSKVPVCGLKPYTGHMAAASDIGEIIAGIKAASDKMVPATLNFHSSEEEFSDLNISSIHQECEKSYFLSTGYGIIGQSASVVVEV